MSNSDPLDSTLTGDVSEAREIQWTVKVTLIRKSPDGETTYESTTHATFDPSIEQVTFRVPFPKPPKDISLPESPRILIAGTSTSPTPPPPPPTTSMTLSFHGATNNK